MGRGWWKATSHVKAISSANGGVMGYKRPLTFYRFNQDNKTDRKYATKTDWIMHEYALRSLFTNWRLCKIKYKGKEKLKEDVTSMENICSNNSICRNITPMQLEFAFEHPLPLMQPPSPVKSNANYDNDCLSNSDMMFYGEFDTLSSDLWSRDNWR